MISTGCVKERWFANVRTARLTPVRSILVGAESACAQRGLDNKSSTLEILERSRNESNR